MDSDYRYGINSPVSEWCHACRAAIGAVCFGERIHAFGPGSEQNDEARRLSAAISETFLCFRSCMFDFPWYRYFRTPTYQRFERAANAMRQSVALTSKPLVE